MIRNFLLKKFTYQLVILICLSQGIFANGDAIQIIGEKSEVLPIGNDLIPEFQNLFPGESPLNDGFGKRGTNSSANLVSPQIIDSTLSYVSLYISGSTTQIVNSRISLVNGEFTGKINMRNSTFFGLAYNSTIILSNCDWNLLSGQNNFENVNVYIEDFDTWITFSGGANASFTQSGIYVTQGFLNLDDGTFLTFDYGYGVTLLTNGHLRSGTSFIDGSVWNIDGIVSGYPDPIENTHYDGVFTLTVFNEYHQSGESHFRILGYDGDRVNSIIRASQATVSGVIKIINDQGLQTTDKFRLFQGNDLFGQLVPITKYREDPAMVVVSDGYGELVLTGDGNQNGSYKLVPSILLLIIMLYCN